VTKAEEPNLCCLEQHVPSTVLGLGVVRVLTFQKPAKILNYCFLQSCLH